MEIPIRKSKPGMDTRSDTVVVLDFETTGLSPDMGDRAIEIGAVLIENGKIIDRFQELMNPGQRINSFIEDYTGIRPLSLLSISSRCYCLSSIQQAEHNTSNLSVRYKANF